MAFPTKKNSVFGRFSSPPPRPTPLKSASLFFDCRLAVSEIDHELLDAQQRYFSYRAMLVARVSQNSVVLLDGPAVRNTNRGDSRDSRESIRRKKPYFHNVRAIRTNCLFSPPEARIGPSEVVLVFVWGGGGIAQLSRDVLQNGLSHRCGCVKLSTKRGIAPFWGAANLLKKYRAIWGIAAIVSQYRAIWGH